jgi:hypothetical protein
VSVTAKSIHIAGLEIPIKATARGPKVAKTNPALEPLAWFINVALDGHLPNLASALTRGDDVHFKEWHAVAQGDGIYRVSVDFLGTTIDVPAKTILEIVEALATQRHLAQTPARQLSSMRIGELEVPIEDTSRGPRVSDKAGELEALSWFVNLALEGRIPDLASVLQRNEEFRHKSLHATPLGDGRYRLSVRFVATPTILPAATVLHVIETLSALKKEKTLVRAAVPVADIPLHRPPPKPLVRPPLPASWQALEHNAVNLDELTKRERTPENLEQEAELRRILWHDMSDLGVFERVPLALPEDVVTLRAYQTASQQLGKYLESHERAKFNPDARPTRMVEAPVSLDWFRLGPGGAGPTGFSAFEWLSYLEWVLTLSDRFGDCGEIAARFGDDWWRLFWRAEDGEHPAVVSATRVRVE